MRMITERACLQKAVVLFLIKQAMLIKLLKCSLITGSPLIHTFFLYTAEPMYSVTTDVIRSVFLGGWDL